MLTPEKISQHSHGIDPIRVLDQVHVDRSNLQDKECATLETLIREYADLFDLNSAEVGKTDLVHHQIHTRDSTPVKQPPRRIPFALRPKVEKMIAERSDRRIFQPLGKPYNAGLQARWVDLLLC